VAAAGPTTGRTGGEKEARARIGPALFAIKTSSVD
jgi:hypothetical protein